MLTHWCPCLLLESTKTNPFYYHITVKGWLCAMFHFSWENIELKSFTGMQREGFYCIPLDFCADLAASLSILDIVITLCKRYTLCTNFKKFKWRNVFCIIISIIERKIISFWLITSMKNKDKYRKIWNREEKSNYQKDTKWQL